MLVTLKYKHFRKMPQPFLIRNDPMIYSSVLYLYLLSPIDRSYDALPLMTLLGAQCLCVGVGTSSCIPTCFLHCTQNLLLCQVTLMYVATRLTTCASHLCLI